VRLAPERILAAAWALFIIAGLFHHGAQPYAAGSERPIESVRAVN
jgi:hypothetical protein